MGVHSSLDNLDTTLDRSVPESAGPDDRISSRIPVGLSLFALALGGFAIGTTEFASMGLLPNIAADLNVPVPTAGHAIETYALGVVVCAPLFAVLGARVPRKLLLLLLTAGLVLGNLLSALAPNFDSLLGARFLAGLPHGAFFGIAAVVAASLVTAGKRAQAVAMTLTGLMIANVLGVPATTWLGQEFGWRSTYLAVVAIAALTMVGIAILVPARGQQAGAGVRGELAALRNVRMWLTLLVGAIGFGGLFAVYSYVTPLLTEVSGYSEAAVPMVLVLIGIGMTLGNLIGGRLADRSVDGAIIAGFVGTGLTLVALPWLAVNPVTAAIGLFVLGLVASSIGPGMTARLMALGGEGQSLGAALHHSAFNIANALGAALGGLVITAGLGYTAPAWVGVALSVAGLAALGLTLAVERRMNRRVAPELTLAEALERLLAEELADQRAEQRRRVWSSRARNLPRTAGERFVRVALAFTPSPL